MNLDFASLIIAEKDILTNGQSDRAKLNSLGEIYYDCSQGILAKSEELLNLATRNVSSQDDTAIDESFELYLQNWLQKSVSVNFLDHYMQPIKRRERSLSSVEVKEIAPVEAIATFAVEEDLTKVLEITHEESVGEWTECLLEIMDLWNCDRFTFRQLVSMSNLSPGRVFLALFLGGRFKLDRSKDFYSEITVECLYYLTCHIIY